MHRNWFSNLDYWREQYLRSDPSLAFPSKSRHDFRAWQMEFKTKFSECLGKFPVPARDFEVAELEHIETAHYIRKRITYRADDVSVIPAYLFIPRMLKHPSAAVICVHGHGRGKVDPAGITATASEVEHVEQYNYNYAEQFAQEGYITLAPDLRCFGERTDDPSEVYGHTEIVEGDHWCDVNFVLGMLIGYNLLTLHIFDIRRSVDLLRSMQEVDSNRIGCVGLSLGGTVTLFSAAYDERIAVAAVSGYLNSWKVFPLAKGQICGSQIVPGLLEYGDLPEVAGLICPRPLFIESGINDPIFPIEGARDSYERVRAIFGAAKSAHCLEGEEFDGVHQFHGKRVFEFFKKHLGS